MSAIFSPCGLYRYELRRAVGDVLYGSTRQTIAWIMLNPSTADANINDPTIRRCIGFAGRWGFASLVVGNLFAFRSTDPKGIKTAEDPIGPENDAYLRKIVGEADLVVCAWGAHGSAVGRGSAVRRLIADAGKTPHHLGLSKDGHPKHPLYLPYETALEAWQ